MAGLYEYERLFILDNHPIDMANENKRPHRLTIKPLCEDEVSVCYKDMLSPFQKEKFIYYFSKFFDTNADDVIDKTDFPRLNQKIFEYTGWDPDSDAARFLEDLHNNFFECLVEKAGQDDKVTLDAWLNMWGKLTRGAMGMSHFPYWLQLLPKVLFEVIDRDHDGIISQDELKHFYEFFVGLDKDKLDIQTQRAYDSMTAKGDYKLNQELYMQIFANFLLGKNLYGPGKYIFGCFGMGFEDKPYKLEFPVIDYDNIAEKPRIPQLPRKKVSITH